MIPGEQRQETGGDNRSHARVTKVSCVTRACHVTRVVSFMGCFLGVRARINIIVWVVEIKSQENINIETDQDSSQTSVNINRQTAFVSSVTGGV